MSLLNQQESVPQWLPIFNIVIRLLMQLIVRFVTKVMYLLVEFVSLKTLQIVKSIIILLIRHNKFVMSAKRVIIWRQIHVKLEMWKIVLDLKPKSYVINAMMDSNWLKEMMVFHTVIL